MSSIQHQIRTSSDEEDCVFAMQIVGSAAMPMAMQAVLELNVLEIIARAGEGAHLSTVDIVSALPTKNPDASVMLDRILRLLAINSVLSCSTVTHENGNVERLYGLAPVCKYFVANDDGISFAPWMNMNHDDACIRAWSGLKSAILGGGSPFTEVHGLSIFDYTLENPQFNQSFNMAMFVHTKIMMKKVLEVYKGFENLKEIIDVGGGVGTASDVIISKYPTMKCINLDLPHVIQSAPSRPGLQHVEGDMFATVPRGDAIFMKWILHDWDDSHCIKLLRNCYEALPDNGKVIVMDMVVPNIVQKNTEAKVISQLDVVMMTRLPGGKERTEAEFKVLAKEAGFANIELVCCVCNNWIMEFHKMATQ